MIDIHEFDHHAVNPLSGKRVDEDARLRAIRRARPLCAGCHCRPAVARLRGRYIVLADHDLCRQCWRAGMDAGHATRLARRSLHARSR